MTRCWALRRRHSRVYSQVLKNTVSHLLSKHTGRNQGGLWPSMLGDQPFTRWPFGAYP